LFVALCGLDRAFKFGGAERDEFVKIMRLCEEFSGVRVLGYVILSNHWHLLLEVPPESARDELSDEEMLRRLSLVSSEEHVGQIRRQLAEYKRNHAVKKRAALRAKITGRMFNLSEFMKMVKWRFSTWFNRRHDRVGALWEGRFTSLQVEGVQALRAVAAYIDLNPVRAAMVNDPKDYRWCSYGAAVAGDKQAQEGLLRVMQLYEEGIADEMVAEGEHHREAGKKIEGAAAEVIRRGMRREKLGMGEMEVSGENDVLRALAEYRMVLFEVGEKREGERRHGVSGADVEKVIEEGGEVRLGKLLRCRVQRFSDGVKIRSKDLISILTGKG